MIQAQRNRPNKDKKGNNTQDPEADYNVKTASDGKRKTTYGFKAHVNVDEDGFVKAMEFTAGNVHDSQVFTELLSGDEEKVFRNTPLTDEQKQRNKILSRTRYIIERFFGVTKLHYGMGKARYLGLTRNKMRVAIICIAHNIKRGMFLQREIEQVQESYAC